MANKLPKNDQG